MSHLKMFVAALCCLATLAKRSDMREIVGVRNFQEINFK